jgi:hypothetical protein
LREGNAVDFGQLADEQRPEGARIGDVSTGDRRQAAPARIVACAKPPATQPTSALANSIIRLANLASQHEPQRMMHSINAFPLMAIPLFMLAGESTFRTLC